MDSKLVLKVRLVRGFTALRKDHKVILKCLGFRHRHQVVALPDTPEVRGALRKVMYLLAYEEDCSNAS